MIQQREMRHLGDSGVSFLTKNIKTKNGLFEEAEGDKKALMQGSSRKEERGVAGGWKSGRTRHLGPG